ncbi:MAG: nucleoside diphosphate kinase regulator [Kofleriaceae bacterium]|nr:nucleoside diphosphate kinase regulator [Kofleriaceae bacterium]
MRANEPAITVTDQDLERLLPILDTNDTPAAEQLDWELRRASVVPHGSVDSDLVTMNADVVYEDLETGEHKTVRVVYPKDANAALGHVSVLAPIGSALLGLRVGQTIEWTVPKGTRRLVVREVHAQR